jgi:hypothetical protein
MKFLYILVYVYMYVNMLCKEMCDKYLINLLAKYVKVKRFEEVVIVNRHKSSRKYLYVNVIYIYLRVCRNIYMCVCEYVT